MTAVADPPDLDESAVEESDAGLYERLVEAAKAIDEISKDKRYPGQGKWAYASAENMISTVRGELLSRGLLVLAAEDRTEERTRETSGGSETTITTVHLTFTIVYAPTGERVEIPWLGRGEDPTDKGVGKALTNAIKTFLRQQLLLPWGDDPEAEAAPEIRANTVNLMDLVNGSGIQNPVLNQILVAAGLPASEKPFGAFGRIPREVEENVRQNIAKAKAAKQAKS